MKNKQCRADTETSLFANYFQEFVNFAIDTAFGKLMQQVGIDAVYVGCSLQRSNAI